MHLCYRTQTLILYVPDNSYYPINFAKAQGKLLTPAQKLAKQRAEAMLEAMRAQVTRSEAIYLSIDISF